MKFFKEKVFLILLIQSFGSYAQINKDTIRQLEEIVIDVNRLKNFTTGNKIQVIDSATIQNYNSNNLGDLLAQQSNIFIKSSSPGNLSTISFRGTDANHTAVLWNGFNIQSPTLGQIDFSLLPVSLTEDIEIQYGGSGALFGSGAIGGTIHLNDPAKFNKGIQASISNTFGSFGNYYQSIRFKISKHRFISSVKIFNSTAENNYPFINAALQGSPEVRQTNAKVKQSGFLIENYYKIKENQQINLRVWIQDNFRQVPPTMSSSLSLASLSNDFYRISSEWKRTGEATTWFVRTAFFNDGMNYKDPLSNLNSNTHFNTSITEVENNIYIRKNHVLNFGLNNTFNQATSDGYPDKANQNRTAVFASYKIFNAKNTWKGTASIRQEMIKERLVPFTPSIGMEGLVAKGISIKGNVSRNYRVPTLNDLYWQPGGNPGLKPESGWSEQVSIITQPKFKTVFDNQLSITFFNSNINNWIIWLPTSGYWTPQNIQSVWSRGLESNLKTSKNIGKLKVDLSLAYTYVVSTNEKVKSINDNSLQKQLIYVPIYSGQGSISLSYRNFYLNYIHTYTGNRFTSTDNTDYIKGYQLGNLIFSKNFLIDNVRLNLNARINNIWNKSYQVVLWQAMPLRYYQVGVSIFFNK